MEQTADWNTISFKSVRAMFLWVLYNNTVCQVLIRRRQWARSLKLIDRYKLCRVSVSLSHLYRAQTKERLFCSWVLFGLYVFPFVFVSPYTAVYLAIKWPWSSLTLNPHLPLQQNLFTVVIFLFKARVKKKRKMNEMLYKQISGVEFCKIEFN